MCARRRWWTGTLRGGASRSVSVGTGAAASSFDGAGEELIGLHRSGWRASGPGAAVSRGYCEGWMLLMCLTAEKQQRCRGNGTRKRKI